MTRRLRVLTLINTVSRLGGAERLAANVVLRLDPARFDRIVCTTRRPPGPTFEDDLRAAGVRILALGRSSGSDVSAWWPLISLLRRGRVDILHAHKFGSNVWGTVLGRTSGVPVVVAHEHGRAVTKEPLRHFLDREVVGRHADVFIAVSRDARRRMIEIEGIDPRVVRYVPNGIPPLPAPTHDVRAELGIAPGAPTVGTASVLRVEKALEVLIQGARLLAGQFDGLRVIIAGRGPEEARLRALVEEAGLEESVLLLGQRTDVPEVLAALDVAVCCSDSEGTPISVIEYMAAAKPVVATRVGGLPEMIDDGVHGFLVDPRDPDALAEAIAQLLRDPRRRAEMGARGRERQRREYDIDNTVRRFELLYEEIFRTTARARVERWTPPAGLSRGPVTVPVAPPPEARESP